VPFCLPLCNAHLATRHYHFFLHFSHPSFCTLHTFKKKKKKKKKKNDMAK